MRVIGRPIRTIREAARGAGLVNGEFPHVCDGSEFDEDDVGR